jgi:hypothetical protein
MAEIPDVPADLIELRHSFLAADRQCATVAERMPTGPQVLAGTRPSEQDTAELAEARAHRLDLAMRISAHPWWDTAGNRVDAEKVLRQQAG